MGASGLSYAAEGLAVICSDRFIGPGGIVGKKAATLEGQSLQMVTLGSITGIRCFMYRLYASDVDNKSMGGRLSHLLDCKGCLADLPNVSLSRCCFLIDFFGSAYPGMVAIASSCGKIQS